MLTIDFLKHYCFFFSSDNLYFYFHYYYSINLNKHLELHYFLHITLAIFLSLVYQQQAIIYHFAIIFYTLVLINFHNTYPRYNMAMGPVLYFLYNLLVLLFSDHFNLINQYRQVFIVNLFQSKNKF